MEALIKEYKIKSFTYKSMQGLNMVLQIISIFIDKR